MKKLTCKKFSNNSSKIVRRYVFLLTFGLLLSLCACTSAGSEPDGTEVQEGMEILTEPQLGLKLTVPAEWNKIAVLAVGGDGQDSADDPAAGDDVFLFRLFEKRAYEAAPQDDMGDV